MLLAIASHRRLTLLLLAFAVILAGAWYKERENRLKREDWHAWAREFDLFTIEGRERWMAQRKQLTKWEMQGAGLKEIEAAWNDGRPLKLKREGDLDVAIWNDPGTYYGIRLYFRKNVLQNFISDIDDGRVERSVYRNSRVRLQNAPGRGWLFLADWLWVVWVGLLLAALAWKRQTTLQDALLIAAVAASATWLVRPDGLLTWQSISSNELLFFAAIMLVISVVVDAVLFARSGGTCKLRFSMKALLIAFTAVALILALGPVGYMALPALLAMGLLFFAVASLTPSEAQTGPIPPPYDEIWWDK